MKLDAYFALFGISRATGFRYVKEGMPTGDREATSAWLRQNKPKHKLPEVAALPEEPAEQVEPKEKPRARARPAEPIDELAALEESYQACIANLKAEAKKDDPDFDLIIKGTQALARVGVEKRKEREAQERVESIRRQTDKAKEILVSAQARAKSMIQTMPRRLSALLAHKDEAEIEQILTADLDHFMRALQDGTLRA